VIRIIGVAYFVVPTLRKLSIGRASRSAAPLQNGTRGIMSKYRERGYKAGRSPHWNKVKNPTSPAMNRAEQPIGRHPSMILKQQIPFE
jgi:hypothetical protein